MHIERPQYGYRRKQSERLRRIGVTAALVVPQPYNPVGAVPVVEVPDVTGDTAAQADIDLQAVGLILGVRTSDNSDTVPLDDIISQDPVAGTIVEKGTAVDVVESLGPALGELLVGAQMLPGTIGTADAEWDMNYASCFGSYWSCSNFVMGTQTAPGDNHQFDLNGTLLDAGKRYLVSFGVGDMENNPGEGNLLERPGTSDSLATLDWTPGINGTWTTVGMVLEAGDTEASFTWTWAGAATGSRIWRLAGIQELLSAHTQAEAKSWLAANDALTDGWMDNFDKCFPGWDETP